MRCTAALFSFIILAAGVAAQASENLTFITPASIPQCGEVNFQWSGGHSPFFVSIETTDNASVNSASFAPNIGVRNYTWGPIDLPAGTPFTFGVRDQDGSIESPVLTVQPSSNSSCLDTSSSSPITTTKARPSATSTSSSGAAAGPTATSDASRSASNSHVPIIVGIVVGVIAFLAVLLILLMVQRRRERRRNHMSSKEALVRTFGPAKGNLDSDAERDIEETAIPDPYVFRAVSRNQTTLAIETEDLRRQPSASRSDPTGTSTTSPSGQSAVTPSSRNAKGERYLPSDGNSPQQTSGAGTSGASGRAGMQEEDIDRLAARMVAMMSAGRLGDQAWAPPTRDRDVEDVSSPPPLYRDVARKGGNHPGEP